MRWVFGYEPQVREIEGLSRERITLSTSLYSGTTGDRDEWRPPTWIMFKALPRAPPTRIMAKAAPRRPPLDPSVAELIESRGHVLLLHGGGATGCVLINDTHLHQASRREFERL